MTHSFRINPRDIDDEPARARLNKRRTKQLETLYLSPYDDELDLDTDRLTNRERRQIDAFLNHH